jgi:Bacterial PH domain
MNLNPDEQLLRSEHIHPAIFAIPAVVIFSPLVLSLPVLFLLASFFRVFNNSAGIVPLLVLLPDFLIGLSLLLVTLLAYLNSEIVLTHERLLYRTGFFFRVSGQLPLENIEGILIAEPLLGRLLGYGTLFVTTVGGAQYRLSYIPKPQVLYALLQKAAARAKAPAHPAPNPTPRQDPSRHMPQPSRPSTVSTPPRENPANPFTATPTTASTFDQSRLRSSPSPGRSILPGVAIAVALASLQLIVLLAVFFLPPISPNPLAFVPAPTTKPLASAISAAPALPSLVPFRQPSPSLAEIKSAAEQGDPQAQEKLADAIPESEKAVVWYRKAAAQGLLSSQYKLAHLLLSWAESPAATPQARVLHSDEALPWLIKAANRDVKDAQLELGLLYRDGRFVAKNLPEAYKWLSLAAKATHGSPAAGLGAMYRDRLVLNMPQKQIAEGNQRLAAFTPNAGDDIPTPDPSYLTNIKLNGLSGIPPRRLAIINGKTVAAGESLTLNLDVRAVTLRCLAINQSSVTITIDGFPGPRELRLR